MADYPTAGPIRAADFARGYLEPGHPPPGGEGTGARIPTEAAPMPAQAGPPPSPLIPDGGAYSPNSALAPQPRTPLGPADRTALAAGVPVDFGAPYAALPENVRGGQIDNRQSEMPQPVEPPDGMHGFAAERAAQAELAKAEPGAGVSAWGPPGAWNR